MEGKTKYKQLPVGGGGEGEESGLVIMKIKIGSIWVQGSEGKEGGGGSVSFFFRSQHPRCLDY